jgi:hypothetical protein
MGKANTKSDFVSEMQKYGYNFKKNKEYLIHTKLGGELFSRYSEERANDVINIMSGCIATAQIEPDVAKLAMELLRSRFYQETSGDEKLMGMLDENLRNVYDAASKKFKL